MTEIDWKARAEAAEARVEELEAEIEWFVEYVEIQREFDRNRLTVTDEMVRDLLDFVGAVAGENRPSREWAVRLRAALTAALEEEDAN